MPVTGQLDKRRAITHGIDTGLEQPVHQRPYQVSPTERKVILNGIDIILANKIVQPSASPWSSHVALMRKKDGAWCFCMDY